MYFSIGRIIRLPSYCFWNLRARIQFASRGVKWPKHLTIKGPLGLSAIGRIELGNHVTIVNDSKYNRAGINHPTQLVAGRDAILKIGNNVHIGGGSGVLNDISDNSKVMGYPAKNLRDFIKENR